MNLEPRTVVISQSNYESAIESFLRSVDIIKDHETPKNITCCELEDDLVAIDIQFKQEDNGR